ELDQKLAARPSYGYMAALGFQHFGYQGPQGAINGGQITIRLHERFGETQNNLFGISTGVFTNGPQRRDRKSLNSMLVDAYYSKRFSEPSLNRPEFWFYGEADGMFSGNEGNSFYVEAGADVHLK